MMTLARFICGLFAVVAVVVFVGLLTIDHWFSIGERAQGGYPTRTLAEQAEAQARSSAATEEARKAAGNALKASEETNGLEQMKRDEVKNQ
jgi:hypothetical protein